MFPVLREYFFDLRQIIDDTYWDGIDYGWEEEERNWEEIG